MIKQKYESWKTEGTTKYGTDFKQWKIKCPSCGHIQMPKDFEDQQLSAETSLFNCIGRHVKGVGCDWTSGGLFKTLGKGRLVKKDGVIHEMFSFENDENAIIDQLDTTCPGQGIKTWNEFTWDEFVPQEVRKQIQDFWLESWGRNPDEWAKSAISNNAPTFGEVVTLRSIGSSTATGRFIYAWNNIGRIIDESGKIHYVSF